MDKHRATARLLAQAAIADGRPLVWFEQLYAKARSDAVTIPWADRVPNPNLLALFEKLRGGVNFGSNALKVGCGLGDDAEWLSSQGFDVTAFDISSTAIAECRARFPDSGVVYWIRDLFDAPEAWFGAFDLVLESYTLQVLPPTLRASALRQIIEFVAPGGHLILIARLREASEPAGSMPWPLTRSEIDVLNSIGFVERYTEAYLDDEQPPVRRFRGCYQRVA